MIYSALILNILKLALQVTLSYIIIIPTLYVVARALCFQFVRDEKKRIECAGLVKRTIVVVAASRVPERTNCIFFLINIFFTFFFLSKRLLNPGNPSWTLGVIVFIIPIYIYIIIIVIIFVYTHIAISYNKTYRNLQPTTCIYA